jgi:serine phosphatase RsbU (regulator of sigma subunit)
VAHSAPPQKRLRLYTEQSPNPAPALLDTIACFPELGRAFEKATGWALRSRPKRPGARWSAGDSPAIDVARRLPGPRNLPNAANGRCGLSIELSTKAPKLESLLDDGAHGDQAQPPTGIDRRAADGLARSIATLVDELLTVQTALRQREAELAAHVQLASRPETLARSASEARHGQLAARLEAVLRAGAEAVGCQSAALYLLDDNTSELKMRSCWGLPCNRLAAPARPLRGAVADLEALLGHAVVLCSPLSLAADGQGMREAWTPPEDYPAAVCVPVSTPTTLLGTLWVFCHKRRDFNDRETNLLEVVAGRLAGDLERETLLRATTETAQLQRQVARAQRLQRNRLPTIAPLLDGWQLAGRSRQAGPLGGAFHDWFSLPKGLLAVAIGRAADAGIVGAINADAVMAALRSHAQHGRQAERILRDANMTLWTGSAGDRHVSGLLAVVDPATGRLRCSSAGRPAAVWLRADGWKSVAQEAAMLGESPEAKFPQFACQLQPGEALILWTDGSQDGLATADRGSFEARLAEGLQPRLDLPADELLAAAAKILDRGDSDHQCRDRAVVVVKRTPA